MAEELNISGESRAEKYKGILPQIQALIADEPNLYANLANIAAAMRQAFGFFWVGFYLVDSEKELVLGPFQGDIACTRISKNRGVCGTCWTKAETIIVDNVDEFPGHIACSNQSKSEIVIPIIKTNVVRLILDVDSDELNDFSEVDQIYLEQLATIIANTL